LATAASSKVETKRENSNPFGDGPQSQQAGQNEAALKELEDKLDYKTIEIEQIQESIEEININLSEDQQAINGVLDGLEK
jgi:hypothetical protein